MEIPFEITHKILNLISEIDDFKGSWKALGRIRPEKLDQLKRIATIESIGSSTRIEGSKLSNEEVGELLAKLSITSFKSRDEEEVAGYAKAMEVVFESHKSIPLDENHIKQLHAILLEFSKKDERHRGEYKKVSNSVAAFDENGREVGIIFETATPLQTPILMEELLEWTNSKFSKKEIHPLLVIAVFIVHFLAIHPFQDGNGRLSRILTTLLLLQWGYEYVPFSSMESIIEKRKDRYYQSLRQAQKTIRDDHSTLNVWVIFFLDCMKKQKDLLLQKMEREKILEELPPLSREIVDLMREHGSMSNSDIQKLTRANRNTIKVHLKDLVEGGHLKKSGVGKGVFYTLESGY